MSSTEAKAAAEPAADKADAAAAKATPSRSPEEVSKDLESARASLVSNIDAIKDRVNPKHIAERRFAKIRRIYVSDEGEPNIRNIAITAGVVTILVLYRIRK